MFSAGTRVYIHSSSITGKKLGPKRHSLGYISDSDRVHIVNRVRNFPIKEQYFLLVPLKIVFTKYGKEEKSRHEIREFINFIPVFLKGDKDHVIKTTIKILDYFSNGEFAENPAWSDLASKYVSNPTNVGTIIPTLNHSTVKMDGNEIRAWITSILNNTAFKHTIIHNRDLRTLKKLQPTFTNLITWLSNAVRDSNARNDLFRWAGDSPGNMDVLVRFLRCINAVFSKRILEGNMKFMRDRLRMTKPIDINTFAGWYIDRILEDNSLSEKKLKIARHLDHNSLSLANCTHTVCSTYLTLKPKYI